VKRGGTAGNRFEALEMDSHFNPMPSNNIDDILQDIQQTADGIEGITTFDVDNNF
jgi:hypothetical protein